MLSGALRASAQPVRCALPLLVRGDSRPGSARTPLPHRKDRKDWKRATRREEMAQCTFSPRIDPASRRLARETGTSYPADKWVNSSPLASPKVPPPGSPRRGGTSVSVDKSDASGAAVMRLVDRFAGVGPPLSYRAATARYEAAREGDVSTKACLRLYEHAKGKVRNSLPMLPARALPGPVAEIEQVVVREQRS